MIAKRYLGDGVYCEVERGMLKLTTENGIEETNTIFLEPETMNELERFYKDARKQAEADVQRRLKEEEAK